MELVMYRLPYTYFRLALHKTRVLLHRLQHNTPQRTQLHSYHILNKLLCELLCIYYTFLVAQ
jgi:hypothetical protein